MKMMTMTLLNKFVLIGTLSEFFIEIDDNFVRGKFIIRIDNTYLTIYYNICSQYNLQLYNEFIQHLPSFVPEIDSCVIFNSEKQVVKSEHGTAAQLFVSGNIKSKKDKFYFYARYLKPCNFIQKQDINIQLEGVWIDKNRFLNILNDTPYVFNIKNPTTNIDNKIKIASIKHNCGYQIKNNIVISNSNDEELILCNEKTTNNIIQKEYLENLLLEWEIMNSG